MAAQVLSLKDQRKSLAAKKREKRVIKSVLGLPLNIKVESQCIGVDTVEKLKEILTRLLPKARILHQNNATSEQDNIELIKFAKNIRNQLALGVNDVNRCVKKNQISAVVLANDIQPTFFVNHLHLLCTHNQTPYLEMPDLRTLTYDTLGFPCIAIGFKKNFYEFTEIVDEISVIVQRENIYDEKNPPLKFNIGDSLNATNTVYYKSIKKKNKSENNFKYLYRNNDKERIFKPADCPYKNISSEKIDLGFIPLEKISNETEEDMNDFEVFENCKNKNKERIPNFLLRKNNEQIDLPEKKMKMNNKQNFKYCRPNIIKVPPNEKRKKK